MQGPVITIDVSKGSCHYQPFIENGHPMHKSKILAFTIDGFLKLEDTIAKLKEKTGAQEIPVIFEATGVYHRPLQKYLEDHQIPYYIISPLLSATYRKTTLNGNKTDSLDCSHIAKAYYCESNLQRSKPQPQEYKRLFHLNRMYEDELVHLKKRKVSFRSLLDIIYPRLDKVFKGNHNLYESVPLEVLKKYPHPSLLLKHKEEVIVNNVYRKSNHQKEYTAKIVHKMYEQAKECYSGCDVNDIEVLKLPSVIQSIQDEQSRCDEILDELISIARKSPNFEAVSSIVGIGENLAARIIAELGDISRFPNKSAVVAYAGLNPKIRQSGDIDGLHLKISKKGNKHLRSLLFIAAECNYRLGKNDPINEFGKKKRQQTHSPMKLNAVYTAMAHKTLVVIYALCKSGSLYQF